MLTQCQVVKSRAGESHHPAPEPRYAELLNLIGLASGDVGADGGALLAAVRCRMDRGHLRAAADLARTVRPEDCAG